jgi:nucleoside-diphosphate-sugar epimerase
LIKKRIAVIGGSGSIGQHLIKFYGKKNIEIFSSKKKKDYFFFDITKKINKKKLISQLKDVSTIIYCSSLATHKKKQVVYDLNYNFFLKFILIIKNIDKKLIYLSTAYVYPKNTRTACNENMKLNFSLYKEIYPYSKYKAEKAIIKNLKKKSYLILRLGALYGLKKSSNFLDRCLNNIDKGKNILFKEPLSIKFNFMHIDQLSDCINFFTKKNFSGIYNVGNFNNITLRELIDNIKKIYPESNILIKKENLKKTNFYINFSLSKLKKKNYKQKVSKKYLC